MLLSFSPPAAAPTKGSHPLAPLFPFGLNCKIAGAIFSLTFVCFSLFLFAWPAQALQAQTAVVTLSIDGYVTDADTGNPLSGAVVQITAGSIVKNTLCDTKGYYAVSLSLSGNNSNGKDSIYLPRQMLGYNAQQKTLAANNTADSDLHLNFLMLPAALLMPTIDITAYSTPAPKEWAGTYTNLDKKALTARNLGQDMPILLDQTPSVQVASDAGNGVGYTALRVRGTDATRINVTLNDVPVNDAESHQVYWVDLPDLASGTGSLQIQRGVGTSTNGTGAFGASVNLQTAALNPLPFGQIDNSYGSFNTRKHTVRLGTGALYIQPSDHEKNTSVRSDYWGMEARLSEIASDGYIDRAASKLRALQLMAIYATPRSQCRLLYIDGHEKTYQAWAGVPQDSLAAHRTYNPYTYDQQIDNYRQTHAQLQYTRRLGSNWNAAATLFYTHGKGFYEQWRDNQTLSDYGLQPDSLQTTNNIPITTGNLIPRLWLDNNFYGLAAHVQRQHTQWGIVLGGAAGQYQGAHFGEVIWAQYLQNANIRQRFYEGSSQKTDANMYAKISYRPTKTRLSFFADLQYRLINYSFYGIDENKGPYDFDPTYRFFNPKTGLSYKINAQQNLYATFGIAHREPTRSNFIDNDSLPEPERLHNLELGYRYENNRRMIALNAYLMNYHNQLIPTGNLNSVGAPIQQNIEKSYRMGIEISTRFVWNDRLDWQANLTLSRNKINSFDLYTGVFAPDFNYLRDTVIQYRNTDIAFSPNIIAASTLTYNTPFDLRIALISKYIGRQYMDNTGEKQRSLSPYLVNNLQFTYHIKQRLFKQLELTLLVNNLFNVLYEANGWTYFLLFEQNPLQPINAVNYNNYYPQAGANYLAGLRMLL